jgi:tetratricopeptide (TPR) repeat protein
MRHVAIPAKPAARSAERRRSFRRWIRRRRWRRRSGYAESQFRFHQGSAYTRLGDTRAALAAQERALAICPADDFTDRALTRLDRAACLAHDGNPTAAVAYAIETLTRLTADQSEGVIALRAQELITTLPPKVRLAPAVRELRELLPSPPKEAP